MEKGNSYGTSCLVCPAFVDVHTHLREPGYGYKETIATGTAAAAASGYSIIASMPNLNPAPDSLQTLAVQEEISAEQMALHKGKTFKCFVFGKGKLGDNYLAARTDGNLIIEFEGDVGLIGTFQNIKVTEPLTYVMLGELERTEI